MSFVIAIAFAAFGQNQPVEKTTLRARLGFRLFKDDRFSSPQGDLQNSCSSCHLLDEDPQGTRAHTDFFARSWVPWRAGDRRRDELRNSPTILDAALMPRLHFDGEFSSLEGLVKGTLSGRPMGWLPGEEEQSFDRVRGVILKDAGVGADPGGSYRALFKAAYDVDTERISKTELIELTVTAITDYLRTLKTTRSTPYDRFVKANGLDIGLNVTEDPKQFGNRLLAKIADLEKNRLLKLANDFDAVALKGMKVFFRADGAGSRGNCVTCHTSPLFTDFSFHNMGISQSEYDQVHGERSFAALEIPGTQSERPSRQYRETPSLKKPGCADLGYWNFVDVKNSALRRAGESDSRFLQRMIGTFKTPTLRDLAFTYPYMHTGGYTTVESALGELMRLSEMARAGHVREGDDELARIMISQADVGPLVTFLMTLNEDLKPGQKY